MRSARCILPACATLGLIPQAAHAHGAIEGAGDFYGGLLHPLVAPAELLVIVACGLLIGRCGLAACRSGIPMLAGAIAVGLGLGSTVAPGADMTIPLALVALIAAAIVTTGLRAPLWAAAGLTLLAGFTVGLDAAPEPNGGVGALMSGAAMLLGGTGLATITAALALRSEQNWQRIAAQVAGSWITASSVLFLTYQLVVSTR